MEIRILAKEFDECAWGGKPCAFVDYETGCEAGFISFPVESEDHFLALSEAELISRVKREAWLD